jgi:hypothetical protein
MPKKKLMLVALAVALAFAALPALAAADPEIQLHEHTSFTVSGGAVTVATGEFSASCASTAGSGKFKNSQEGTIEISYHECKSSGISCTTSGSSTGTITTTELSFRVKSATEGKLAILITPNSGHFSTFKCSFIASVVVSGNGLIGIVTSPEYGKESSTATIKFSGEKGVQSHKLVDGEETEYSLKAALNGGSAKSASVSGETSLSFEGAVQPVPILPLSVAIKPTAGVGTVKSTPIGIHCVIFCQAWFAEGTKVKLEVVELTSNFKEWKAPKGNPGTCTKVQSPCELTLDNTNKEVDLEAVFK